MNPVLIQDHGAGSLYLWQLLAYCTAIVVGVDLIALLLHPEVSWIRWLIKRARHR